MAGAPGASRLSVPGRSLGSVAAPIDTQYEDLLRRILEQGTPKQDRTGTGTVSLFGERLRYDLSETFPLVTTKKVHFKSIAVELLWFLRGDSNVGWLRDQGVRRVFLAGLATDFCVGWSGLDALGHGFGVVLVEDACRGIGIPGAGGGPDSTAEMLARLRARGAESARSGELR